MCPHEISLIPDLLFDTCLKLKFSNIYICRPCLEKRKEEEDSLEGVGGREQGNRGGRKDKGFQDSGLNEGSC